PSVGQVDSSLAELVYPEGLVRRADLVEGRCRGVDLSLGEAERGEVRGRAPARRGAAADLAGPAGNPAPQRDRRRIRRPALDVVHDEHVAGRPLDQAIRASRTRGLTLVELEADVGRR